jgi:hypothetical protein
LAAILQATTTAESEGDVMFIWLVEERSYSLALDRLGSWHLLYLVFTRKKHAVTWIKRSSVKHENKKFDSKYRVKEFEEVRNG